VVFIGVGVVEGLRGLAPQAEAEDDERLRGRLALGAGEVAGPAEAVQPRDADVGGDLSADLVAEAEADLDVVEAGADAPVLDLLERERHLALGLEHQALREEEVVGALQPGREVALVAQEEEGLDLEEVRREPLEPDGELGPGAEPAVAELGVEAEAGLGLEVGRDEAAVEGLDLGLPLALGEEPLAFGADEEPVVVGPDAVEPLQPRGEAVGGGRQLEDVEEREREEVLVGRRDGARPEGRVLGERGRVALGEGRAAGGERQRGGEEGREAGHSGEVGGGRGPASAR
jgi:hypothetical protein